MRILNISFFVILLLSCQLEAVTIQGDTVKADAVVTPGAGAYVTPSSAVVTNAVTPLFSAPFNTVNVFGNPTPYMSNGVGVNFDVGPTTLQLRFVNVNASPVTFPDFWTYLLQDVSKVFTSIVFNAGASDPGVGVNVLNVAIGDPVFGVGNNTLSIKMAKFTIPASSFFGQTYVFDFTVSDLPTPVPEPATYLSLGAMVVMGLFLRRKQTVS